MKRRGAARCHIILFHRTDGTGSGRKQAVNYPNAGTYTRPKSTEDGIAPRVEMLTRCPLPPPSPPPVPPPHSFRVLSVSFCSTGGFFSPIKHPGMRACDGPSWPSTSQRM